jgi:hypothetical protein
MPFALVIALLILLSGCTVFSPVVLQTKDVSISEINAQCRVVGDPFYQGASDRIYSKADRRKTLTADQYRDLEKFKKFCMLPEEDRKPYDYGYWAGGEAQGLIKLFLQGLKIVGVN